MAGPYDPYGGPPGGEYPPTRALPPGQTPPSVGPMGDDSPTLPGMYRQPPHVQWPAPPAPVPPPAQPYPYAPAAPARPRRGPWGLLAGVLTIVLVACGGTCLAAYIAVTRLASAASATAQAAAPVASFCIDEQVHGYVDAYQQLSSGIHDRLTLDQFIRDSQAHDRAQGGVASCKVLGNGLPHVEGDRATLTLQIVRYNALNPKAHAATFTGTVTLIHGASGWRIDSIAPALPLL